jgi:hypothetical protein
MKFRNGDSVGMSYCEGEVSTGSGSDRVTIAAISIITLGLTPVATAPRY